MQLKKRTALIGAGGVVATGVAGFELNFSSPHGLPERKKGAAMGQDNGVMAELCRGVL